MQKELVEGGWGRKEEENKRGEEEGEGEEEGRW